MASLSLSLSLLDPTTNIITQTPSSRNPLNLNNITWKCFTTITHYSRLKSSHLNPIKSAQHNPLYISFYFLTQICLLVLCFFCFSFSWFLIFYKRDQLLQSEYSDQFNLKPIQSEHPATIMTHRDWWTDPFKTHWSCWDPKLHCLVISGPWRRGFWRSQ